MRHDVEDEPTSHRHRYWIAAGATAAVLLGGWFVLYSGRPPSLPQEKAQEIATAFLTDVREGRVDEAWAGTSAEFKSAYGRDRFRDLVRSKRRFRVVVVCESCNIDREHKPPIAECLFRTEASDSKIKVILSPENGEWKVGGISAD